MAQEKQSYRIVNTTKKAPRLDKNGVDQRHISEKNGHNVQWRDERDQVRLLSPDKVMIVNQIPEGLMRMHQDGLVRIEPIKDMSELMKSHTETGRRTTRRGLNKKEGTTANESSSSTQEFDPKPRSKRLAKAVEMGKDDYSKRVTMDGEPGTNPDGVPNFAVVAPSAETRKKNKEPARGAFVGE